MKKRVQAYFHTENEAETVRIKLQAYNIDKLEIGALPEPLNRKVPLLIPFGAAADPNAGPVGGGYAGGSSSTDSAAAGAFIGFRSIDELAHDRNYDGADDRELLYSLSLQTTEADYGEVVKMIRSNGGHIAI